MGKNETNIHSLLYPFIKKKEKSVQKLTKMGNMLSNICER